MNDHAIQHVPVRAITEGPPHFFGYYDKCPWSPDRRRLLAMRAAFQDRPPTERDPLILGTVDLGSGRFQRFAETTAWCWQQGTMLQWLPDGRVIYNSRRPDGSLCAIVHDLASGRRRELPRPVYAVHPNGREAISLDFHRLQRLRPGYGYPPAVELSATTLAPDNVGLWRMDLQTGADSLICSIRQIRDHDPHPESLDVPNWVNHATYNTDGSRFCFLHRFMSDVNWKGGWATRLFTLGSDGEGLYLLNSHLKISHFGWRDPRHLCAWARVGHAQNYDSDAYYVFEDLTGHYEPLGHGVLQRDGHMTYSPSGRWMLTDEYPDPADGCQPLLLFDLVAGRRIEIGRFAAPLSGELRCDLHPRFSRDGRSVCFDSAHEGTRQVYIADVSAVVG